ncbi:MAG: prepilin-type N-terminal cleavage/methylation domain-containing protein [Rhodanobacter sp.]|jgi:general secretion pathway protein I|nr:prepilin-type N-terminal cleavage/methylation domain-containing protein [Rhodanobacter sp.]MBN8947820.1 prepilin-type N-terminal cleavage/methylation domain-containing protein [Rhodanobacter sp.]
MRAGNRESGIGNRQSKLPRGRGCCSSHSLFPIPHSRRAPRANGFTLLEVIAAIALLAIAFTVLMRVAGGSIRLSENAADHSEAALWARSLLDTAFTNEPVRPGSTSGRFDQRFRWQLNVAPWRPGSTPAQAPLQLYQLDLEVSWGPAVHPQVAHFRTLRLAAAEPAQAQP